jgi:glutamate--cysteine ligase
VEDIRALRAAVPRTALRAEHRGRPVQAIAADVLAIARDGLKARGLGEEVYLAPLDEIVSSGQTQADRLLALYHGAWRGDARQALLHTEV